MPGQGRALARPRARVLGQVRARELEQVRARELEQVEARGPASKMHIIIKCMVMDGGDIAAFHCLSTASYKHT